MRDNSAVNATALHAQRSVLVVDDDAAMRDMLIALLEDVGHEAVGASDAEEAVERLRDRDFDAVVSDIRMPGRTGIELVGEIREIRRGTPIILMTAFGSIDSAVEGMQAGAFDYVTKPFKRDAILLSLRRAFEHRLLQEENRQLRRAVDRTSSFGEMIGASDAMREIFALIRTVAESSSSVLISGESGTGKELVARTLHFAGARSSRPFIPVNCTAFPEGLIESELFGHVRGAFTGAIATKRGLFEEAEGGTLFLDEIGDMGLGMQSKMLRVLQDKQIRSVGSNQNREVDVRIITATNRDLKEEIQAGRFRKDLYYRLNVIPIEIPPLRDRPDDIPLLAKAFLRKHGGDRSFSLSPTAMSSLQRGTWEGNARELENVIERAIAFAKSERLESTDLLLPDDAAFDNPDRDVGEFLDQALALELTLTELDDRYITRVLESTHGNKARAAKILGINRRTLYRRGFGGSDETCSEAKVS